MTLATLSHLLHPHPKVTPQLKLNEPLAGALLISPWVEMKRQDAIFHAHELYDILGNGQGASWADAFRGGAPLDNYTHMREIDPAWFKDLKSVVAKIYVWAGSKERLLGSINDFTAILKKVHNNVEYLIEVGKVLHVRFIH